MNEEPAIRQVLASIPLHDLEDLGVETHIVVIDGHSTDRTCEIARAHGADVLVQRVPGKGSAVRLGLEKINPSMAIVMDADASYPAEEIPAFVRLLNDGADMVIGSRLAGTVEPGAMSQLNRLGNRFLSSLASSLFGVRVSDVCTGMWGLNARALSRLNFRSSHFELEAEIFAEACRLGLRIREVPIRYRPRLGVSKLNPYVAGPAIAFQLVASRMSLLRPA